MLKYLTPIAGLIAVAAGVYAYSYMLLRIIW